MVATACAAIPSPRPVKPSFSVVVALTLTRSGAMPRIAAIRSIIATRCGPIFGRSQMIVTSTAATAPRASPHQFGGVAQELVGRRAAPARIARREVHADIAGADRTEHRVGQGVKADIGIGMTDEAPSVRDFDAADPEMITGGERVYVEALPDADIALPGGDEPLGCGEIFWRRHLQIVFAAVDDQRAPTLPPRQPQRRRSGRGRRRRGARRGSLRSETLAASARATARIGRSSLGSCRPRRA